jgi:hypothetical protein
MSVRQAETQTPKPPCTVLGASRPRNPPAGQPLRIHVCEPWTAQGPGQPPAHKAFRRLERLRDAQEMAWEPLERAAMALKAAWEGVGCLSDFGGLLRLLYDHEEGRSVLLVREVCW